MAQLKESRVEPSRVGTFEFSITAPSTAGTHREFFNVVADGSTWLNDVGAYYSFNVVNSTAAPNPAAVTLNPGEVLGSTGLIGPLGQTSLELQSDGNLVLNHDYQSVWKTNTQGTTAKELVMQNDGNLVLYNNAGQPVWFTGTSGNPGAKLSLQLDGNMVIYSAGNTPLWQSGTSHNPSYLSYVNTILQPSRLLRGQWLETADRRYKMVLQNDGNLVLYSPTRAIWSTRTNGSTASYLAMQLDGNLVLYDANNRPLWQSQTNDRGISALVLQQDGNLVTYQGMVVPTWNTQTRGQ
jgi:hypothetical protein